MEPLEIVQKVKDQICFGAKLLQETSFWGYESGFGKRFIVSRGIDRNGGEKSDTEEMEEEEDRECERERARSFMSRKWRK